MLNSNLNQQRLFVVGEDSLFEESVTHLLTQRTDFRISSAKYSDELVFLDTIKQELPDVLLVCESFSLDTEHIINLVFSQRFLMALFIVVIRLKDNVIETYEMPQDNSEKKYFTLKRIVANSEEDLLIALRRERHAQ
jgi:hypothetical protein